MKRVLFFFLLILSIHFINAQPLSQRLDALLHEEVLKTSEVGIAVFDLTTGKSVYRYQDEKLYRPASVEKIITSVTALAQLGADYTMDTGLRYRGKIENDTLKGSLYLIGGFESGIYGRGSGPSGRCVGKSRHPLCDRHPCGGCFHDRLGLLGFRLVLGRYSLLLPALSFPLMLNRGCVDVSVSPAQKDSLPKVVCTPVSDYYQVHNHGVSRNPQAGKLKITRNWLSNGNIITVSGNVSYPYTEKLNVYTSKDFFFHTFVSRLRSKGIEARTCTYADCPVTADSIVTLYTVRRPLKEVLERALKKSDNLCAESMFYHLAAKRSLHKRVTGEDGTDAIHAFMKTALGFNPENYKIADGSGVSVYNYISPRLLLEYLKYAYYHREIFLPFYESLPIAGVDGTLQNRMKQTKARGNVHAKTGSVTGVSSLAGYVKAADGHQLAFVIINQNVLKLSRARAFQDKFCDILSR